MLTVKNCLCTAVEVIFSAPKLCLSMFVHFSALLSCINSVFYFFIYFIKYIILYYYIPYLNKYILHLFIHFVLVFPFPPPCKPHLKHIRCSSFCPPKKCKKSNNKKKIQYECIHYVPAKPT